MLKCKECGATAFKEEGYETVYRCFGCNYVGNKNEFKEVKND